ncbi:Putative U5 small nuclear ribonucleoprotein 200 kDa helicase [Papilio machaon]|uniref:Putative U5 small nuclear ribonucleoprotein 200 kDa helicase n=1 Tax=Papilio machaon TaxID=76193 RepID=A0A0N1IH37_PAPMA|nr:Putative U5 small nuclear ribonucleoprotein 200 kDa helicase [Papilio machaon]
MTDTDHGDSLLRFREKHCKRKESTEDRYKKCGLLNLIQHIDIYGTFCSSYHENRRQCSNSGSLGVTSVMSHSSQFLTTIQGTQRLKANKLDKFTMLKETLSAGVAYLHEGVEPSDRRLVQQLLESGAAQLCVVAAELAWAFAAHVHNVIVADTHV